MNSSKDVILKQVLCGALLLAASCVSGAQQSEGASQPQLLQEEKEKFAKLLAELEPLGDKSAPRHIGVVSSLLNVFPGEPPKPEQMRAELSLAAGRREHESAQIVISAGPEPVSVEGVEVTDLRQTEGEATISSQQIEVRLVGYAYLDKNSWRGIPRLGLWPDPLLRLRPFRCPPGQARCLWVTVQVPADAVPGEYTGVIRLRSQTQSIASVPVRLRVLDFALPQSPQLHTSYWNDFLSRYDSAKDAQVVAQMIRLFGAYRISTNVWQPGDIQWYRETDGSIRCDLDGMLRHLEMALDAGFRTLNLGPGQQGCWGDTILLYHASAIDRATGQPLRDDERKQLPAGALAQAYLQRIADCLDERGVLDRAYLPIRDEEMDPSRWSVDFRPECETIRGLEPRIQLLSVLGIHPATQGLFDIWSPHLAFFDRDTYEKVRRGISLYGPKNFAATITASSTGGWSNPSFYLYQPVDAYDGCTYTKWIPREKPTKDTPQWLRFDFEKSASIDGLRLEPYGEIDQEVTWACEGSADGENFQPLRLTRHGEEGNSWSFEAGTYKAIRLVWTRGQRAFVATDRQPQPPPEPLTVGVREVEFLREGLPLEATQPRGRVRPVQMMWEYQVGANYPSVCIDADPAEIRATGWQCWVRGLDGYLNYGAAQWGATSVERPRTEDPLVWASGNDGTGNGSPMIVYPGRDEVLPSIRFARFRDGVDDFDALTLLAAKRPTHPLVAEIRRTGHPAYASGPALETNRQAVNEALAER